MEKGKSLGALTASRKKEGSPVKQFSLVLENRVGLLADISKSLEEARTYILGLSSQDAFDYSIIRFICSDPDAAREVFRKGGISFRESVILVAQLKGGAASLPSCLASLLLAETNLSMSYALLSQPNGYPAIAIYSDDIDFAGSILNEKGFKILKQEDLSR